MSRLRLQRDLRRTGAGQNEAAELAKLAESIGHIKLRGLSAEARDEIARIPGRRVRYWHLPARYAAAGTLAIAVILVGFAQSASPGSPLYSLKRSTERVRAWLQPDYVDTLVEERKSEVEQLIQEDAAPDKIEQAERIYEETKEQSEQRPHGDSNVQQDKHRPDDDKRPQRTDRNKHSNQNDLDERNSLKNWLSNPFRR